MTISLVQINVTIGDLDGNTEKIIRAIRENSESDIIVFSELVLQGYLSYDFFAYYNQEKVDRCIETIQHSLGKQQIVIFGLATQLMTPTKTKEQQSHDAYSKQTYTSDILHNQYLYNCAAMLSSEGMLQIQSKSILPYYDVFLENRFFHSLHYQHMGGTSEHSNIFECHGHKIGVLICEDIWYAPTSESPIMTLQAQQPSIVVCLSASPYEHDKLQRRIEVCQQAVNVIGTPLVFVNLVGGNDEVIFDGSSFLLDENAELVFMLKHCQEDQAMFYLSDENQDHAVEPSVQHGIPTSSSKIYRTSSEESLQQDEQRHHITNMTQNHPNTRIPHMDSLLAVLELGLVDYLEKNVMSRHVHLGLSGGIDSALTAVLAVRALGKEHVTGILLPSQFTSTQSIDDAQVLARTIGISTYTLSIHEIHTQVLQELEEHLYSQQQVSVQTNTSSLVAENVQARIRGMVLMAYSNKNQSTLLTTGNKSEIAVGYCTLYGDMCGSLNLIGDLYKTEVYELANYLNRDEWVIPQSIIEKEPTAELRENQKDTDSLPPYDVLDTILHGFIEERVSPQILIERDVAPAEIIHKVWKLYMNSEYKRYQSAPIIKVSSNAFGRGRIVPLSGNFF